MFRFENCWLQERDLPEVVTRSWNSNGNKDVVTKLNDLSSNLAACGRKLNREFKLDITRTKEQIAPLRDKRDQESIAQVQNLKEKLSNVLIQYTTFWKQRAKQFWLKEGDSNTKFFHSMAT